MGEGKIMRKCAREREKRESTERRKMKSARRRENETSEAQSAKHAVITRGEER